MSFTSKVLLHLQEEVKVRWYQVRTIWRMVECVPKLNNCAGCMRKRSLLSRCPTYYYFVSKASDAQKRSRGRWCISGRSKECVSFADCSRSDLKPVHPSVKLTPQSVPTNGGEADTIHQRLAVRKWARGFTMLHRFLFFSVA